MPAGAGSRVCVDVPACAGAWVVVVVVEVAYLDVGGCCGVSRGSVGVGTVADGGRRVSPDMVCFVRRLCLRGSGSKERASGEYAQYEIILGY